MARSLLLALVVICGTAYAQDSPPAATSDQGDQSARPGVLAEMDGYLLTEGEFDQVLTMLPTLKKETLTPEQKQQIIQRWMLVVAGAEEAEEAGLDQDPLLAKQVEFYRKQLLFDRHQRELIKDLTITEEETRKYYEENPLRFTQTAQFKISRIVLPTREKADEVNQALKSGQAFEELATRHSIEEAGRQNNGDIGWVSAGGGEPAFEEAVAALEPNQISAPFETKIGWQIVRLAEKRPEMRKEFADVQEALSKQLLAQKQRTVLGKSAAELFKKHEVKIYNSEH
jgi:peptidyl-prolyl cis-trans isomerase C